MSDLLANPLFWALCLFGLLGVALAVKLVREAARQPPPPCPACGSDDTAWAGGWDEAGDCVRCGRCQKVWVFEGD